MVSWINISMSGQIYGPGPVHAARGGNSSSTFRSHEITDERQTRRKVAIFSRLLLFDDVEHFRWRGATFQHLNRCPGWTGKDEPYWSCRPLSTRRGRDFAYECCEEVEDDGAGIETRALRLERVRREAEDDVGASSEMFKAEQTHSQRVTDVLIEISEIPI